MHLRYATATIVSAMLLIASDIALPTEDETYPIWCRRASNSKALTT